LAKAAADLYPSVPLEEVYKVYEKVTCEADLLFDQLHHELCGDNLSGLGEVPLICYLRGVVSAGGSVACWCGAGWENLPVARDWDEFLGILVDDVSNQPPEASVLLVLEEP